MNKKGVIIFLSVFLGVFTLVNYYIYTRGYNCLPDSSVARTVYNSAFGFFFLSFIFGKILERTHIFRLSRPVSWISSFWLGAMLYFFIIILTIDIIRLLDFIFGFLPSFLYCSCSGTKEIIFYSSLCVVLLLLTAGFINARHPAVRKLNIDVKKKVAKHDSIKIVAVSDIHMGILFGRSRTATLAKKIKKLNPDIILFVGDLIDEVPLPVIELDMGAPLRELNPSLGKYAVTGNHEFIGGVKETCGYIETLGIKILRDEWTCIDNSLIIAGRDDKDGFRFTRIKRKNLIEVLSGINKDLPLVLMDHQPFHLAESELSGVDLQLSGHTHHGQLWPLNYITRAIFELSWGYLKKGNTHYYVSCGYGTWVPQVRIGNRPEILDITMNFD
jgi:uncharacterized protein